MIIEITTYKNTTSHLRLAILITSLLSFLIAYAKIDCDELLSKYDTVSIAELHALGSQHVERLEADSALFYYSLASSLYSDKLSAGDKEECAVSMLNTGYIWLMMLNNAEMAYPRIIQGIEICRKEGFDQYLPISYDYLAHIYDTFGDKEKAMAYYKKAFQLAVEKKIWWSIMMCYTDLLSFAHDENRMNDIHAEMKAFGKLKIPNSMLSGYAICLHNGMLAYTKKDFQTARNCFITAIEKNDAQSGREHGTVLTKIYLAETYAAEADYKKALAVILDTEHVMKINGFWDLADKIYRNIENYYKAICNNDSAKFYHYTRLEIKDSIFNSRRFGKIKDMEMSGVVAKMDKNIQRISIERDSNRQLALILGSSLTIIICLLYWVIFKNHKLQTANGELYRKNIELLNLDENRKFTDKIGTIKNAYNSEDEKLMSRICKLLEESEEVFDPEFSIERLAELANSNPRYVSRAINDISGNDFRALVAKYRIKEACIRLQNEALDHKVTIESIAGEVGYRSRTHFTKVFKETTGLTPTEYIRQVKKNEQTP